MSATILKPRKALNKAYLKSKPNRSDIEVFKKHLVLLIDQTNDTESEEFHKNLVTDFLKKTYYDTEHFINTKGRNDLVIHNGKKADTTVGVIIEAKKPTNKSEMLTNKNLNTKAFQELVLYFLRERISQKNLDIKHLIATNINEWFIFDVNVFEKLFAQNKKLVIQFEDFEAGRLSGTNTDFFYKEIAKPFIDQVSGDIEFTYFDLKDYEKPLRNDDPKDDNKLIALFKLLSPEHLLKLPFANDSNSLDKKFYAELLHIIGLTETKVKGKKIIERHKAGERNAGSLLENAIIQLDTLDKIHRLEKPSQYGETNEERLFNVGLELAITWVNRILFLKLLEAQLISYHKGDQSYAFLDFKKIKNYDDLNSLFFQVLAKRYSERNTEVNTVFDKVPYLNSSLFEPSELEHNALFISNLRDEKKLPILSNTVLKDDQGKKLSGDMNALEYLFAFLDAYDFSSDGAEEIQEENKTLINASVLGLIFEKINGYKDGSFFTPGFITMYMCSETIRRSVVQKFNDAKGWNCNSLDDLYDKIEDRQEANDIINSLKICDPAVGSGHFLVSALNEIISIKNDLKVLQDRDGKRLKEYQFEVVNDELVVTDEDGELFEYIAGNKESQRVQEALFHEKQTIIENCLFGVDINPNSVKICRLRLWIELLKNSYYKNETELETLPNIDINIKCGNSLISRFDLDADIKEALKKSNWNVDTYRSAVASYRNAQTKSEKHEMERLINDIKSDFRSEISKNDPKVKRLYKLNGELALLTTQTGLFDLNKKEKAAWNKKVEKLTKDTQRLELEIEEIKNNKIYENAFEWRFEFPEVLNDEGDFVGFDTVIGNPPYVQLQSIKEVSNQLKQFQYETYSSMGDLYALFYERGRHIMSQSGFLCFITGSAWMRTNYGQSLRTFFNKKTKLIDVIDLSDCEIFESATVLTSIITLTNKNENITPIKAIRFTKKDQDKLLHLAKEVRDNHTKISKFPETSWIILNPKSNQIKERVESLGKPLKNWDIKINRGILTGYNEAFVIDKKQKTELVNADPNSAQIIKPLLRGRDVHRYYFENNGLYLINTHNGLKEEEIEPIKISEFPAIKNHLDKYYDKLKKRGDKGYTPYNLRNCAYLNEFEDVKIIYPNMTKYLPFTLDREGHFLNDKCFILTGEKLYFLVSFLNSKLFKFCFADAFPELQGNSKEIKKFILETIPVFYPENEASFKEHVTQILSLKKEDPAADTSPLEAEIDQLVYELYGLTEEEIAIVEEGVKD